MEKAKLIILTTLLAFALPFMASAATLSISPSSGSHPAGTSFTVNISVSSADQAMNAASGTVHFSTDTLEVVSLSKSGSISSLWVAEPSFSNTDGKISFESVVLNPGFTGTSGKLLSVTFRGKQSGTADVGFSSASVLANDGSGADILKGMSGATFVISAATASPTPVAPVSTLPVPIISSPTHRDQGRWYPVHHTTFAWSLPSGVSSVRLLIGKLPDALPTIAYSPAIAEKDVGELEDGIWYFHVQFGNAGQWGPVAKYRVQIDTLAPERFDVSEIARKDQTDPRLQLQLDASDALSGIDHYAFTIDGGEAVLWADDGTHHAILAPASPGTHTLEATAVDKAGNAVTRHLSFAVAALAAPDMTAVPQEQAAGNPLLIRGTTVPNADVTVSVQKDASAAVDYVVKSDGGGKFIFATDNIVDAGTYRAWAKAVDSRGAQTSISEKMTTVVIAAITALSAPPSTFNLQSVAEVMIALIVLLATAAFLLRRGVSTGLKRRLRKDIHDADKSLHRTFDTLRDDVRTQVKSLEHAKTKRMLTEAEEKVLHELRKELDDAEDAIRKGIEDIDKELE